LGPGWRSWWIDELTQRAKSMPRGHISKNTFIIHRPGEEPIVYNPGDLVPPHIELDRMAERLKGDPLIEGTDVPVAYLFYYLDSVHNLYAFLSDFPEVSREQAFQAIERRLQENIESVINSDREYVSGTPRFNGTRMTVYTMFEYLADGYDIEGFLDNFDTSVTLEHSAKLLRVAKQLVEFYAYMIAFERIDANQ
jgi:uncharacterized protein (DUF433 family)